MIVFLIVLFLLLVVSVASYLCYRLAFHSPNKWQNDIRRIPEGEQYVVHRDTMLHMVDALEARPSEQVFITSYDGLRLAARYYHTRDNAPLAICFHGYRSTGVRDFSGGAAFCLASGQNVLLVDQRAQGLSEGHTMTFGVKEQRDCLGWVRYAVGRFGADTRIVLYGISMGAATVLMATGLPLPPNVKAAVADCPYHSTKAILKKVCRDLHMPAAVIYPFLFLGAFLYGHFLLSAGEVTAAVANAAIPLLILHGEDDRFVPCEMSRQLYAAFPDKIQLETFPDTGHGISYLTDRPRYEAIVTRFLESVKLAD